MRRLVFVVEQEVAEDLEWDEYDSADETIHVLAQDGDVPVGAARFRPYHSRKVCKIERVAILPTQRSCGLGRNLMEFVEQEAVREGYEEAFLHAQTQALGFYEKLNYEPKGERFWEAGIEHVAMRKTLV